MSEITTLWNQWDKPQDLSEVWNPSEEDGLKFLEENSEPRHYPKHIIIQNRIGYMIMPGIYYFGEGTYELSNETKIDPIPCSRKIAMITDCSSFLRNLLYLAVDETNIELLHEIRNRLGKQTYCVVVNEPPAADETQTETEDSFVSSVCDEMSNALADFFKDFDEDWNPPEPSLKPSEESPVESTAEELMPGLGICDICVSLKCIFLPRIAMNKYQYAYKSGDRLVLIHSDDPYQSISYRERPVRNGRQEYDLRIVEELIVCRKEVLHCGLPIDRYYPIISCRKQKIKQLFAPETYEMLQSALANILPSEESFEAFLSNTMEKSTTL